jgi:hypothetical protein
MYKYLKSRKNSKKQRKHKKNTKKHSLPKYKNTKRIHNKIKNSKIRRHTKKKHYKMIRGGAGNSTTNSADDTTKLDALLNSESSDINKIVNYKTPAHNTSQSPDTDGLTYSDDQIHIIFKPWSYITHDINSQIPFGIYIINDNVNINIGIYIQYDDKYYLIVSFKEFTDNNSLNSISTLNFITITGKPNLVYLYKLANYLLANKTDNISVFIMWALYNGLQSSNTFFYLPIYQSFPISNDLVTIINQYILTSQDSKYEALKYLLVKIQTLTKLPDFNNLSTVSLETPDTGMNTVYTSYNYMIRIHECIQNEMDEPTRYQFGDISGNIKLPTQFLKKDKDKDDSSRSNPRKKSDNNSNTPSSSGRQFVLFPPPTPTYSNKTKITATHPPGEFSNNSATQTRSSTNTLIPKNNYTLPIIHNRVPPINNLTESDAALYRTLTDSQRSYLDGVWYRLSNDDGQAEVKSTLKIITNFLIDNPGDKNYKKYVQILLNRLDNSTRDLSSSTVSTNTPASPNTGDTKPATTSIKSEIPPPTPNGPSNQASVVPPKVASNVLKRLNGSEPYPNPLTQNKKLQNQTPNLSVKNIKPSISHSTNMGLNSNPIQQTIRKSQATSNEIGDVLDKLRNLNVIIPDNELQSIIYTIPIDKLKRAMTFIEKATPESSSETTEKNKRINGINTALSSKEYQNIQIIRPTRELSPARTPDQIQQDNETWNKVYDKLLEHSKLPPLPPPKGNLG